MKRFVTYLYACERGYKSKNLGFIRVNVRGSETSMEIYIRNYTKGTDQGVIYGLFLGEGIQGIRLGNLQIQQGQSDSRISFVTDDIFESKITLKDIEGIGIRLESGAYIASCWKDAHGEEIIRNEFTLWDSEKKEEKPSFHEPQMVQELLVTEKEDGITYEKIDLSQIRNLPSPNWHFTTNSFLVHGFWNYGYLVLKKAFKEGQEILSLGVPGIFEKPEAVMAVFFGFPSFEEIPEEMVSASMNEKTKFVEKEKNQEAQVGTFGCWFVTLRK